MYYQQHHAYGPGGDIMEIIPAWREGHNMVELAKNHLRVYPTVRICITSEGQTGCYWTDSNDIDLEIPVDFDRDKFLSTVYHELWHYISFNHEFLYTAIEARIPGWLRLYGVLYAIHNWGITYRGPFIEEFIADCFSCYMCGRHWYAKDQGTLLSDVLFKFFFDRFVKKSMSVIADYIQNERLEVKP